MGIIEKQSVQDIANAIRDRNGLTTLYKPREMDEAILNLYSTTKVNSMLDYILPCHEEEATDFTIKYADSDRPCSISELEGNTTQNGTPTPTSPVEIKTVSGDNNIVVSNEQHVTGNSYRVDLGGKNKLDANTLRQGARFINTLTTTNRLFFDSNYYIVQGETYTISTDIDTSVYRYAININDKTFPMPANDTLDYDSGWKGQTSFTFTATVSGYLGVPISRVNNSDLVPSDIDNYYFQLEKGTEATPYSPYVSNPIELCKIGNYVDTLKRSTGKNLYNYTSQTDDGWYSDIPNFINDTGTYTLSINNKTLTGNWAVYFINSSKQRVGEWIKASSSVATPSTFTVTTEQANAPYIRILPNASGLHDIENYNIMVNEGSTALPYEPYGNNWYIEKNIGKVVLDGTQTIALAGSGVRRFNATYSTLGITNIKDGTSAQDSTLNYRKCDHFAYSSGQTTWGGYYMTGNWLVLYDSGSVIADANALKTWFTSNPTTIYYVKATPSYEIITNENLLEQLNNIQDIKLIENLCYVDWVGVEKPKMKLFCYLDKDKIIEEITG